MSLSLLPSKASNPKPNVLVDANWVQQVSQEVELSAEYMHSVRRFPVILDAEGSTKESAQSMRGFDLIETVLRTKEETAEEEDMSPMQPEFRFAGTEVRWNNEIRKMVITEGLEHFVPQILYLLRPETAYVSCLHFIAQELGGQKDFEHQRSFIFKNPGIQTLMTKFWIKVQKVYWSGAFCPSIGDKERLNIFLALVECFLYSNHQEPNTGENTIYCPHIDLALLHEAGVYLPSIEFPDLRMTQGSIDKILASQKRTNLPGIPSDLGSYVECNTCGTNTTSQEEMQRHVCLEGPVKCEGCGLSFPSKMGYRLHSLTFCKQGPLSQSKCPVCNTTGPKCICQVHWNRTYSLVASIFEGTHEAGAWLAEKPQIAGTLMDVSIYLGVPLTHDQKDPRPGNTTPSTLNQSLWNPALLKLPGVERNEEGLYSPHIPMMDEKPIPWKIVVHNMAARLEIEVRVLGPMRDPDPEAPVSTKKSLAKRRLFAERHLGTGGIQPNSEATLESLKTLDDKIKAMEKKMKVPAQANIMSMAMGKTKLEIQQDVDKMKDLRSQVAIYLAEEDHLENRQEMLDFTPTPEDSDNEEDQDKPDDQAGQEEKERGGAFGGIFLREKEDGKKEKREDKKKKKEKSRGEMEEEAEESGDEGHGYLCRNESHLTENPPYRIFLTEAAKVAHLSRNHHCIYKKDSPPCLFYYEREEELGRHLLSKHPLPGKDEMCPICGTTLKKEALNTHMEAVHVQCPTCHQWYEGLEELREHWDNDGGTCRTTPTEVPARRKAAPIRPPETLTLAKLPDIQSSHENFLTEAMGILLDQAFPAGHDDQKEKAKNLISSYSFHQAHLASISKNPYKAMSQSTIFLEQPSFSHGPGVKERSFDKAMDKVQVTDLSPFVNRRFENYLLADSLSHKITSYTKQYMLSESSAVYLFTSHLSQENQDTLRSNYRRNPQDLSYYEICSGLQFRYFNIDLKLLRDGVANLRKGPNEHAIQFHNRAYKLSSLAAINFPENQRADWVEEKVKELFYKSLDNVLKMEVDQIEAKHGVQMSSTELLETWIARANLRSNPVDLNGDTLLGVARVKDSRTTVQKTKKVNIVTSFGALDVKPEDQRAKKGATRRLPARKAKANTTREEAEKARSQKAEAAGYPTPEQRLKRDPSPIGRRERLGLYQKAGLSAQSQAKPSKTPEGPRKQYVPKKPNFQEKQEAYEKLMKDMDLTPAKRAEVGIHCWSCGRGRKGFDEREPHRRRDCHLPFYNGPPHNCKPGVKLLHHESDCPARRARRIRLED